MTFLFPCPQQKVRTRDDMLGRPVPTIQIIKNSAGKKNQIWFCCSSLDHGLTRLDSTDTPRDLALALLGHGHRTHAIFPASLTMPR